jgi:hypothetical protein
MAMAVVLTDDDEDFVLSAAGAASLARLGVTNVTLVRGDGTTGVVLEGWAFDPASATEAVTVLRGRAAPARTLRPVAHTAVSAARQEEEQR